MHRLYNLMNEIYWWKWNYQITYVNIYQHISQILFKNAYIQIGQNDAQIFSNSFMKYYIMKMCIWTNDFIQFY